MADFLMILNAQHGHGDLDIYNAMQDTTDATACYSHVKLSESPIDCDIAISETECGGQVTTYTSTDRITIICYGNVTNYHVLSKLLNTSVCPCELIIELYKRYGIDYTVQILDGYCEFIMIDASDMLNYPTIYVVSDHFGVSPLWIANINMYQHSDAYNTFAENKRSKQLIAISSNKSQVINMLKHRMATVKNTHTHTTLIAPRQYSISEFPAGNYIKYNHSNKTCSDWISESGYNLYYTLPTKIHTLDVSTKEGCLLILRYLKQYFAKLHKSDMKSILLQLDGDIISLLLLNTALSAGVSVSTFSCGMIKDSKMIRAASHAKYMNVPHTEIYMKGKINAASQDNCDMHYSIANICAMHIAQNYDCTKTQVILAVGAQYMILGNGEDMLQDNKTFSTMIYNIVKNMSMPYRSAYDKKSIEMHMPFLERDMLEIMMSMPLGINTYTAVGINLLWKATHKYSADIVKNAPPIYAQYDHASIEDIHLDGSESMIGWVERQHKTGSFTLHI